MPSGTSGGDTVRRGSLPPGGMEGRAAGPMEPDPVEVCPDCGHDLDAHGMYGACGRCPGFRMCPTLAKAWEEMEKDGRV